MFLSVGINNERLLFEVNFSPNLQFLFIIFFISSPKGSKCSGL